MRLGFYIVDVFAQTKYAGNQLAVFVNTHHLADQEMQQIAKEMNYSETTFISSLEPRSGGYDVRIFTPEQELPFAGHPTIGTAYILQTLIGQPVDTICLNLKVGQIPVTLQYQHQQPEELWMQQKPPQFGQQYEPATIAPLLNLSVDDIDSRFPIQAVSTGVPFFIVPLRTHAALKRAKVNREPFFEFIQHTEAQSILIFCPETYDAANQLSVRVFADAMGIPEDPATGSANGCLAGYLANYAYFGEPAIDVRVEQGHEIGRPSLLLLKASKKAEEIEVFVGGKAIMVAKGEFV
jgi:trans-2,3-dihydro-3-hydroxyanthranilate isomerase